MSSRLVRARRLSVQSLEARDVPAAATLPNPSLYLPHRVIVQTTDGLPPKAPVVKAVHDLGNSTFLVDLRVGIGVPRGLTNLRAARGVVAAEPDYIVHTNLIPNDPSFGSLWGLHNIGQSAGTVDADIDAPEAWDFSTGGSIGVGIIDTGIDYRHPDLYKNIWINQAEIPGGIRAALTDIDADGRITFWDLNNPVNQGAGKITDLTGNGVIDAGDILTAAASGGWADGVNTGGNAYTDDLIGWDFVNNDNNPLDDNDHGTHVAGTIGAMGNNGVGVAGINFHAQMAGLKFLGASGSGSLSGAINAVNYAVGVGLKVTNNSWGGGGFSLSLNSAITAAMNAGQIFVAAAGNAGTNNDTTANYPSNYTQGNVLAVGSSTRTDARSSFSNYGATTVDLFAPGSSILSTTPNNTYSTFSGTSMAAPHVTGAIALVWDAHPTWTYQQVITSILSTVDVKPAFQGISVTGGRLNVDRAIRFNAGDTAGPSVMSSNFSGAGSAIDNLRVTLSEAINPASFTSSDVAFTGPGGNVAVTVTPVVGSSTQFDVAFASQSAPGEYVMTIGPNITDVANNPMNQDGDGTNGETPADQYVTSRVIPPSDTAGPQVTAAVFNGSQTISSLRVTFNEAIDAASFTPADAAFTGPGGSIAVTSVSVVPGTGNSQFDVNFATQTALGTYTMVIGPDVTDGFANPMNQDADAINGETPDDQFSTFTTILDTAGPRVTSSAFNGANTTSQVRFTFTEEVDPLSFTPDDVALTGPLGTIGITGVAPVAGSGNTQFDVSFATQSAPGNYSMVIGPDIRDLSNNPMNQDADGTNGEIPADQYTATRAISNTTVFNSTDVNKTIRDVTRTISVLTINQDITIADLNLTMSLSHTWDSDLRVTLIGPDGTQITLVNRRGGSGDNFATTFNDEAATSIVSGLAPFNGSYRPEQALSAFDGKNARGTWQLVVDDLATFDTGRINSWSLTVQS